jgi:hypothetical protein
MRQDIAGCQHDQFQADAIWPVCDGKALVARRSDAVDVMAGLQ